MNKPPSISVIIPTYNRHQWLRETLATLAQQNWPTADPFEVIVVDDGSTDQTSTISTSTFPFPLRYIHQSNQGDAEARNTGAKASQADILIFFDDDMLLAPNYLRHIAQAHGGEPNKIIVGTPHLWLKPETPAFYPAPTSANETQTVPIAFADICSNNMAVGRDDYFAVGQMQNLGFKGSSIWCDVDFAYRAYQRGFQFLRSPGALCWHRDHVFQSLDSHKRRMWQVAYRAARLFQIHPELMPYLPMFSDKTPIALRQDSTGLVVRKAIRALSSSKLVLLLLETAVTLFDKYQLAPTWRERLHVWVVGGYIFQGYRNGLRELSVQGYSQQ